MKLLSICIPTVVGREDKVERLVKELERQKQDGLSEMVEIIVEKDNKEISIGTKRDLMYNKAGGLFSVQIDDDDFIDEFYIHKCIMGAYHNNCCIGYKEHCLMNGEFKTSIISLRNKQWNEYQTPANGIHYERTPFFKTPIKTDICKAVGVKDMRYGEDHDFAIRIYPHLKSEYYIDEFMYYYSANSLTAEEHQKRYGIR